MRRLDLRSVLLALAAPVLALLIALSVAALVILASGADPLVAVRTIAATAARPRIQTQTINTAVTYYLAAVAVAIGFRMNLFNIGVDGQYRVAAMAAAAVGAALPLPPVVHQLVIVVVAMAVGAAWAGVAAVLKVTRGVSEVISTIMLNAIATALVAWLILPEQFGVREAGSNNIGTAVIAESGRVASLPLVAGSPTGVYGLIVLAAVVGVGYWFLLGFTRFGFDLRATGASASAAVASGVNVKRMVSCRCCCPGPLRAWWACRNRWATPTGTPWTSPPASDSPGSRWRCWAATTRWAWCSGRCCGRFWNEPPTGYKPRASRPRSSPSCRV